MKKRNVALLMAAGGLLCVSAYGQLEDTVSFQGVNSGGANPANQRSYISVASYVLDNVAWRGNLTEINTGTFASEARVNVSLNSVSLGQLQLGTSSGWTGTISLMGSSGLFGGTSVGIGDVWDFTFVESFDDGFDGIEDAIWDMITFDFNSGFVPPEPPQSTMGVFGKQFGSLAAGAVNWYSFEHMGGDLFATTTDTLLLPEGSRLDDSELGIYDSAGNRLGNNDDIDFPDNPYSEVLIADAAPGTYYIAVGEFNTTFNATAWDVTSTGTDGGSYSLRIIPAPASAMLAGLGGLLIARRRR